MSIYILYMKNGKDVGFPSNSEVIGAYESREELGKIFPEYIEYLFKDTGRTYQDDLIFYRREDETETILGTETENILDADEIEIVGESYRFEITEEPITTKKVVDGDLIQINGKYMLNATLHHTHLKIRSQLVFHPTSGNVPIGMGFWDGPDDEDLTFLGYNPEGDALFMRYSLTGTGRFKTPDIVAYSSTYMTQVFSYNLDDGELNPKPKNDRHYHGPAGETPKQQAA